ncbi:ATP-binding protein [Labrys neptuniae]|uniref:ATP-binding protein n=1 Tax=Labrys neptuniae TaxID=376174 RepID=UPI00288C9DFD|nr:ATP-binding protein [Labrys neptuniae]MDT3377409.1 ATP-binding protein [Labrys neptuniae]
MTIQPDTKAAANPTKTFFVRMITRDISLEDCILDLIDNSVDGAWKCEGSKPVGLAEGADLQKYRIDIEALPDHFRIIDNCGGMSLTEAVEHAFSFGRQATDKTDDYSIGVYGIGMKRAVFKLGEDIRVRSTFLDDEEMVSFAVPIKVGKWLENDTPPWDFDLEEDAPLANPGVEILVHSLTPGAVTSFGNPAFLQNLKRTIARDYSLHLARGLTITVNGEIIQGWKIELRQGNDFAPMRIEYQQNIDGSPVTVEIIGGMAAPPPDDVEPDEEDEGDKRFGWYVVCNGRIVLAADKTTISGWDTDGWPQWHRQYSGFMGVILFTSANAASLPLTTTKRSVDVSSEIYRQARPKMREVTRKWIDYTNIRKQAAEEAKRKEATAVAVSIQQIPLLDTVRLPTLVTKPKERVANVSYSVSLTRLKKLSSSLGNINLPYRDVGLKSFEYTYDDLVGGE